MRKILPLLPIAFCAAGPAGAQVTVDLHALDSLPSSQPAPARPAPPLKPRPKVTLAPAPAAVAPSAALVVQPAPDVAPTPAPTAVLPDAPLPAAPPPAAPIAAPPAEAPKAVAANVRVPFAADQSELSPDGQAAIKGLIATTSATGPASFTIVAYAAGKDGDPSAARRLSLARAMAARGALLGNGVPSGRITVRALGGQAGDGPADRVDIAAVTSATP